MVLGLELGAGSTVGPKSVSRAPGSGGSTCKPGACDPTRRPAVGDEVVVPQSRRYCSSEVPPPSATPRCGGPRGWRRRCSPRWLRPVAPLDRGFEERVAAATRVRDAGDGATAGEDQVDDGTLGEDAPSDPPSARSDPHDGTAAQTVLPIRRPECRAGTRLAPPNRSRRWLLVPSPARRARDR